MHLGKKAKKNPAEAPGRLIGLKVKDREPCSETARSLRYSREAGVALPGPNWCMFGNSSSDIQSDAVFVMSNARA